MMRCVESLMTGEGQGRIRICQEYLPADHFTSILCYKDSYFPLGGGTAISCGYRPAVSFDSDSLGSSHIDHRFNCEHHTRYHKDSGIFFGDIAYPGVFMKFQTDSVAADMADYVVAVLQGMFMDGMSHISYGSPGFYLGNSDFNTFFDCFYKFFLFRTYLTDAEHSGRIGKITVVNRGDIHIYNIPCLQNLILGRDSVAYNLVYRGTDTFGEALIVQRGRYGSGVLIRS